jgi:hypothetical protein
MAEEKIQNINELVLKIDEMKKQDKMDLSLDQDLSIAIMNLISIEEHFFFTGAKTGKSEYYDLLNEVREMRKTLLKKIITQYEGEVWCISKHLLAACMRLMEVGTKQLTAGNKKEAEDLFEKAYGLYSLFWGVNMKLINIEGIKSKDEDIKYLDIHAISVSEPPKQGIMRKLGELVKKAIDCCFEIGRAHV